MSTNTAEERHYAQPYCTEQSRQTIGFIDFVIDGTGHGRFIVRVPQGAKPFPSLLEAETWMQSRVQSGVRLVKA
jgi:hypothetical protein